MDLNFIHELIIPAETKIVMLIMDGLGGLAIHPGGKTELETAHTPNLDELAGKSSLGLTIPMGPGITVESGPGHLAIFGYDPTLYHIGRGVLEAAGLQLELKPNDVAARGNFCTINSNGVITDRRAGRIPTDISKDLAKKVSTTIEDIEFIVETVKEHRLAVIMRGIGLSSNITGTDPLKNGHTPLPVRALDAKSKKTARVVTRFLENAGKVLQSISPPPVANMMLMRGFDHYPEIPLFPQVFNLRAAAIAINPTYKGIARLVGMDILPVNGDAFVDEVSSLESNWTSYDFFYIHIKNTDLAGEDGDFNRKVQIIEEVDAIMPQIMALSPDVLIVSGDHSSPAVLKGHSWHPVPTMLYGKYTRADGIREFGEQACRGGSLGILPASHIMSLALANALRLNKYG
jgi:2,3-bisphosphoglycerate-independent phosphoglycerate mutase